MEASPSANPRIERSLPKQDQCASCGLARANGTGTGRKTNESIAPEEGTQVVLGDVARVLSPVPLDAGDAVVVILHDPDPRSRLQVTECPLASQATIHVSHRLLHMPSIKSHKGGQVLVTSRYEGVGIVNEVYISGERFLLCTH
jgi:hypothetical protein